MDAAEDLGTRMVLENDRIRIWSMGLRGRHGSDALRKTGDDEILFVTTELP